MTAAPLRADPVHDAEVAFLTALTEGRQPAPYCDHSSYRGLTVEQHNAQLSAMRAIDKARQRARKAGRAQFFRRGWEITDIGRAWLAAHPAPSPEAQRGRVGP